MSLTNKIVKQTKTRKQPVTDLVFRAGQSKTVSKEDYVKIRRIFQSTTPFENAKKRWFTPIYCHAPPVVKQLESKTAIHSYYQISKDLITENDRKLLRKYLTLEGKNANQFSSAGKFDKREKFALYKETDKYVLVPKYFGLSRWGMPKHDFRNRGTPIDLQFGGTLRTEEPSQVDVVDKLYDVMKNGTGGACASLYCGYGKCFGKGTSFFMFDGTHKNVEDLRVGDVLMGDDSTARTIDSVNKGVGQMYSVVPESNSPAKSFTCNGEHILVLQVDCGPELFAIGNNVCVEWLTHDEKFNRMVQHKKLFSESQLHEAIDFSESIETKNNFLWEPTVVDFLKHDQSVHEKCFMYMPNNVVCSTRQGTIRDLCCNMFYQFDCTDRHIEFVSWVIGWIIAKGVNNWSGVFETKNYRVAQHLLSNPFNIQMNYTDRDGVTYIDFPESKHIARWIGVELLQKVLLDESTVRRNLVNGFASAINRTKKKVHRFGLYHTFTTQNLDLCKWFVQLCNSQEMMCEQPQQELNGEWTVDYLIHVRHKRWRFVIDPRHVDYYYGFTVDGNQRMLLSDYTVTHNTVVSSALTCKLGVKTLFVAHTIELVDQSALRFQQFCPGIKVGFIQGPRFDVEGKDVIFSTVQSLVRKTLPPEFVKEIGFLIFDEGHHAAAKSFSDVTSIFNPAHTLCLSATLDRKDGLQFAVHCMFGGIAVHEERPFVDVDVDIIRYRNKDKQKEWKWGFGKQKGKPNHNKMVDDIIKDETRNQLIIDMIERVMLEPNRTVVIQTERVQHAKDLCELLLDRATDEEQIENNVWNIELNGEAVSVGLFTGGHKYKKTLKEALGCRIIFATDKKMKEGIDNENIDTFIFAIGSNDVRQSTGRALRIKEGKNRPRMLYIADVYSSWLNKAKLVEKYYREELYNVRLFDYDIKTKKWL
jgi:hypothetical protein